MVKEITCEYCYRPIVKASDFIALITYINVSPLWVPDGLMLLHPVCFKNLKPKTKLNINYAIYFPRILANRNIWKGILWFSFVGLIWISMMIILFAIINPLMPNSGFTKFIPIISALFGIYPIVRFLMLVRRAKIIETSLNA